MKAEIEAAFPVCSTNHCVIETDAHQIFIQDTKGSKCVITASAPDAHFTVNNTSNKNITFIAIDKCIWDDQSGHKKCDFAITDSVVFAFVEIKDTDSRSSEHKKKAKEQLEETIVRFSVVVSLTNTARKAIVAWKYIPTRPVASTLMQSAAVHFWNTYKVEFLEGNEMSF